MYTYLLDINYLQCTVVLIRRVVVVQLSVLCTVNQQSIICALYKCWKFLEYKNCAKGCVKEIATYYMVQLSWQDDENLSDSLAANDVQILPSHGP